MSRRAIMALWALANAAQIQAVSAQGLAATSTPAPALEGTEVPPPHPRPPPPPIAVSASGLAASRDTPDPLGEDHGWLAGTIQSQLDRDPNLVPFGKGAIFVPAMTNAFDEPPVSIWYGDQPVAEGTTGQRIILTPGTYQVRIGSGANEQERISAQVTVKERQTAIVPPSWAALQIHVIDEQYSSIRASYELIRVADREYIGLGFGTDEQAGEPLSTWILRPGLYKIVRVGENYRARRDFSTVRIQPGEVTHFLLVVNADTGDFIGGGEVPEDELFRPRAGFFGSFIVGGDLALNSRSNVVGLPDGTSFTLRAFADGRLSARIFDSPLVLQLQIEEGQTKSPNLPFQKTNDRVKLDALYVYQLAPWIGPYIRARAETNIVPGEQAFTEPTEAILLKADGSSSDLGPVKTVRLSPPVGLSQLREGVGLHVRAFKSLFGEMTFRAGLGARHRIARDLYEPQDDPNTVPYEFHEITSTNLVGAEATVLGAARITRWVLLNLEFDTLVPFEGIDKTILDLEASLSLKLTSYVSVNYVLRLTQDASLHPDPSLQQDVRLRFSWEVL
ncbi:MAG: hypothetical protein U1E65_11415 [Myxococcota bacterium]